MELRIRYFASLTERAGGRDESIEIDAASDIHALWRLLVLRHPPLGEISFRPMVACDQVYAEWDRPLDGVEEVAFLPPVSGG